MLLHIAYIDKISNPARSGSGKGQNGHCRRSKQKLYLCAFRLVSRYEPAQRQEKNHRRYIGKQEYKLVAYPYYNGILHKQRRRFYGVADGDYKLNISYGGIYPLAGKKHKCRRQICGHSHNLPCKSKPCLSLAEKQLYKLKAKAPAEGNSHYKSVLGGNFLGSAAVSAAALPFIPKYSQAEYHCRQQEENINSVCQNKGGGGIEKSHGVVVHHSQNLCDAEYHSCHGGGYCRYGENS